MMILPPNKACAAFLLALIGFASASLLRDHLAAPSQAQEERLLVETHYAPAENLEAIDVRLIGAARRTIDMAAYVLTDIPVIDALAEAGRRGVRVRLYRDGGERQATGAVAAALDRLAAEPGVEIRFKGADVYMHLKSYCVDGRTLRAGAANFSASGLKRQENDLLILEGPTACARFAAAFATMWRER